MIKCIAIDDEPIALRLLERYASLAGLRDFQTYTDPFDGFEKISKEKPDLVLLDIEMNEVDGMDIAKRLPHDTLCILTSAHGEYALQGFDIDAVDFLHKPFSYDRFLKAIEKATAVLEIIRNNQEYTSKESAITIIVNYQKTLLQLSQIIVVRAMDNYIEFNVEGRGLLVSQMTLKSAQNILPKQQFLRVHKSFIVNRAKIQHFSRKAVEMEGCKTPIPVGRTYASAFMKMMEG